MFSPETICDGLLCVFYCSGERTIATSSVVKPHKQWTEESMKAAFTSVVNESLGL